MSDKHLEQQLRILSRSSLVNRRFTLFFLLINVLLSVALVVFVWRSSAILAEQIAMSPQLLFQQAEQRLVTVQEEVTVQYQALRAELDAPYIVGHAQQLGVLLARLQAQEYDWQQAIKHYSGFSQSIADMLGGTDEWSYFYQRQLQQLEQQSAKREQALLAIKGVREN
jgi:hypothetical protein